VEALKRLIDEAKEGRRPEPTGLDPETQVFLDLLLGQVAHDAVVDDVVTAGLSALAAELVAHIRQEIALVGFWQRATAREALRSWIFQTLDDADLLPFDRLESVADRLMELAKANHHRLVR
jgi:type I restriction enzyme R subunit